MKPREKLQHFGPDQLEDHELIALILGRGSRKEDVFSLSQRLSRGFDREELLTQKKFHEFKKCFQLGEVGASQLMAAIEIGRRFFRTPASKKDVSTIEDIFEIVKNMQYLKKEHVRGLYLNTRNRVIHDEIISIGSLDANIFHPREIFRPAIEYSAYAVIIVHNHPSGDCQPSATDLVTTKKIVEASNLLQIPLLDHLIVGENSYYSFHQNQQL